MEAYLDNSATTKCFQRVADTVSKMMLQEYGNPSSLHRKGMEAEQYIKNATSIIANNLKVSDKEIIYTSGGTEADNLAVIGTAMANYRTGKHIITTAIEHPAVTQCMKYLANKGFNITSLPVDSRGCIRIEDLKRSMNRNTILVSIMYVNNEVGFVKPIEEVGAIIKNMNPKTIFHGHAVQAFGK